MSARLDGVDPVELVTSGELTEKDIREDDDLRRAVQAHFLKADLDRNRDRYGRLPEC